MRRRLCLESLEKRTLLTVTLSVANGDVAALIADLQTANQSGQPVAISLASKGTYDLTLVNNSTNGANGLPVVTAAALTLDGNVATIQRDPSASTPDFRIFDFGPARTRLFRI